jgi:hypothetical protein
MQRHRDELTRPPDTDQLPLVSVGLDGTRAPVGVGPVAAVAGPTVAPHPIDDADVVERTTRPREPGDPMPS